MTQEIDAFMKYLQEVKKISKNTAVSYETDLRKMKEFLYSEGVLSVEDVYEPYLMQIGFLSRTPRGRMVTPAAYRHLGIAMPGQQQFDI